MDVGAGAASLVTQKAVLAVARGNRSSAIFVPVQFHDLPQTWVGIHTYNSSERLESDRGFPSLRDLLSLSPASLDSGVSVHTTCIATTALLTGVKLVSVSVSVFVWSDGNETWAESRQSPSYHQPGIISAARYSGEPLQRVYWTTTRPIKLFSTGCGESTRLNTCGYALGESRLRVLLQLLSRQKAVDSRK